MYEIILRKGGTEPYRETAEELRCERLGDVCEVRCGWIAAVSILDRVCPGETYSKMVLLPFAHQGHRTSVGKRVYM